MKKAIAIIAIVLGASAAAFATGTTSAQFLKLGAGARAAAMGDAFGAVADDATAAYWNPAGLTQVKTTQISLTQNAWLVDSQYQFLGAALPYGKNTFAFSLSRLDHGSIDRYDASNQKDGTFTAGSMAGAISFASSINDHMSFGMTAKYIQETIESAKGTSFAGDFGVLAHYGAANVAATVQNIGPAMEMVKKKESLPQMVRLAASTRLLQDKMLVGLDLSKAKDTGVRFHSGVEYKVIPAVSVRGGYALTPSDKLNLDGLTSVTGGIGVNLNSFTIDYAFVPFGELGNSHKFSLMYRFNGNN